MMTEQQGMEAKAPFQWSRFFVYLGTFAILILVGVIVVGTALGLRPLEARAAAVSQGPVKIEIAWPVAAKPKAEAKTPGGAADAAPKTWLPKPQQEEVLALAHDALGSTRVGLSRSPLERVGDALAASGWFEGTPKVRRGDESTIIVEGEWRVPAAVVRKDDKDYLISWDAKPMPPVYDADEAKSMRVITGPALGPPMNQDGTRDFASGWAGEDIAASLELLALMLDKPWAKQVAGIDASDYSAHGLLSLVTPEKTRVVWGGRPSKPLMGEVSTAQKLAYLGQLMHDCKRIDAGHGVVYINNRQLQFDISASATQP
jgi:hypothetical protein